MALRPSIFVSAVSKELRSTRQLVANTLQFLGYEPVWQDVLGTEQGDLREMLRRQIDQCKGVLHLVGQCYGAEPPAPDEQFGRVSYTQFEALYARGRGMNVWYLVLDKDFPTDPHEPEPEELAQLQADYRQRTQADTHLFHPLSTQEALEACVLKMRKEFKGAWGTARRWAAAVIGLLILAIALVGWLVIAEKWHRAPNPITEDRANAAFVSKDYAAAFEIYSHLSDADPANIQYHRRIEECARLGHLEKPLLDRYLALVQSQPSSAIFHNYLGNAYLMLDPEDKDGKAHEEYEAAVRLDPGLAAPLMNLGILAYRAGKTEEAEDYFKRYLALAPDDAQGWVNLGLLYVGRLEKDPKDTQTAAAAENALRKALQIDPGSAPAYKALGRLFAATGRKREALDAYQRSLALNIDQSDVRQQVELLAWESSGARFPGIADDFRTRSAGGQDTDAPAPIIVLRLLDQGEYQQAEAICLKWTEQEPKNPLAWSLLAKAYEAEGHAEDAGRARAQMEVLLKQERQ